MAPHMSNGKDRSAHGDQSSILPASIILRDTAALRDTAGSDTTCEHIKSLKTPIQKHLTNRTF